jgi:hypothetical protein
MNCYVSDHEVTNIPVTSFDAKGNPKQGTGCLVKLRITLVASDGSTVTFSGVGHGMDRVEDKAAGKASTYAWKDALVKGLSLPDDDMDDTDDQHDQYDLDDPKTPASTPYSPFTVGLLKAIEAASTVKKLDDLKAKARTVALTPDEEQELVKAFASATLRLKDK